MRDILKYFSGKGASPESWNKIRDKLIDREFLYRDDNRMLRSKFADAAYEFARKEKGVYRRHPGTSRDQTGPNRPVTH